MKPSPMVGNVPGEASGMIPGLGAGAGATATAPSELEEVMA